MTISVAPLSDGNGRSQCYTCRNWDWAILVGLAGWEHVCNSPLENLIPGDCVIDCPGYKRAKKKFGVNVSEDGMVGE